MEALGLILTYDFNDTASYVICISSILQNYCFLHYQMCDWAYDKIINSFI